MTTLLINRVCIEQAILNFLLLKPCNHVDNYYIVESVKNHNDKCGV